MDTVGADFLHAVKTIDTRLHAKAVAMRLPIGAQDTFKGIIDLLTREAEIYDSDDGKEYHKEPVSDDMKDMVEEYREKIIEAACDGDDELAEKYLEGETFPLKKSKLPSVNRYWHASSSPYSAAPHTRTKVSRCFWMLSLDYLPSPLDIPPVKGTSLDGEEEERPVSDSAPLAALAFKIMADPFVGKLAYFRVYSGEMHQGTYVLNSTKDKKERVGRILLMHANHRKEIDVAYTGDITHLTVGFKDVTTGDTLCDPDNPIIARKDGIPGSRYFRCC